MTIVSELKSSIGCQIRVGPSQNDDEMFVLSNNTAIPAQPFVPTHPIAVHDFSLVLE